MNPKAITRPSGINVLVMGARSTAALELIRQFSQLNVNVYSADTFGPTLASVSRYTKKHFCYSSPRDSFLKFTQSLNSIVVDHQIDMILPTCEEVFYLAQWYTSTSVNPKPFVWVSPAEILNQLHNKSSFIQLASRVGSVPKTELVSNVLELRLLLKAEDQVVKPAYSRFAAKTCFLNKDSDLSAIGHQITTRNPWLVQQKIEGVEYCSYAVVYEGKVLISAIYRPTWRAGLGAGIHFQSLRHEKIEAWVKKFVELATFTGQIAFDFIEDASGDVFPLECNPRATSGVHFFDQSKVLAEVLVSYENYRRVGAKPSVFFTQYPPSNRGRMIFGAMLSFGLRDIRNSRKLIDFAKALFTSRDVIFKFKDILPSLYQVWSVVRFVRISRRHKISILDATTHDIEWNGQHDA